MPSIAEARSAATSSGVSAVSAGSGATVGLTNLQAQHDLARSKPTRGIRRLRRSAWDAGSASRRMSSRVAAAPSLARVPRSGLVAKPIQPRSDQLRNAMKSPENGRAVLTARRSARARACSAPDDEPVENRASAAVDRLQCFRRLGQHDGERVLQFSPASPTERLFRVVEQARRE